MLMALEVVAAPRLSVALAVRAKAFATFAFQVKLKVPLPFELPKPTELPLAKNSTLLMLPSGSEAAAVRFICAGAAMTRPLVGEVTLTVGGRFCAARGTKATVCALVKLLSVVSDVCDVT